MPRLPISFVFVDFDGTKQTGTATISPATPNGLYVMGIFGCGKTRDNPREAIEAYLGGRELVSFNCNLVAY